MIAVAPMHTDRYIVQVGERVRLWPQITPDVEEHLALKDGADPFEIGLPVWASREQQEAVLRVLRADSKQRTFKRKHFDLRAKSASIANISNKGDCEAV
ncbi:hypothetical protein GCM10025771_00340 [Niveibacterium umoris]